MPYIKGDFTQQGVAGDVTALVRLNEKRTVKLTLSADDESDNCDISGTVYDALNDKTYNIGSGGGGGGGDSFPVCTITFVNNSNFETALSAGLSSVRIFENNQIIEDTPILEGESSATFTRLYCYYADPSEVVGIGFNQNDPDTVFSNLVNCTIIEEGDWADMIAITDPSADASLTITYSAEL